MVLAAGGFAYDPVIAPIQPAVVHCERNTRQTSGRRRTASFTDWNFIGDAERERRYLLAFGLQNLTVGIKNEVVFDLSTELRITAVRHN